MTSNSFHLDINFYKLKKAGSGDFSFAGFKFLLDNCFYIYPQVPGGCDSYTFTYKRMHQP